MLWFELKEFQKDSMVGSGRVDEVFTKDEGFQTFVVSSLRETIIIWLLQSILIVVFSFFSIVARSWGLWSTLFFSACTCKCKVHQFWLAC